MMMLLCVKPVKVKNLEKLFSSKPFSYLPKAARETFLSRFESRPIKKNVVLLTQETSPVEKFLVLSKGLAQYYFEQNNEKTLQGTLGEGGDFGGISILLNGAVAIRTLEVIEDSVFLELDIDVFLKTCAEVEPFKTYFTNSFGRLMLNKSYSGIIARQIKDKEFNLPFFNQPISAIFKPNIIKCSHDATVREAAQKMAKSHSASIFLKNRNGKIDSIITDADLREKAIAKGKNDGQPASTIASAPVVTSDSKSVTNSLERPAPALNARRPSRFR